MSARPPPTRHIYVTTDTERVVSAAVTAGDSCIDVQFHVGGGHLPVRVRADLVDTIFGMPEIGPQRLLRASVPLGDTELLAALRRRCISMDTRAAGVTCLVDGILKRNGRKSRAGRVPRPVGGTSAQRMTAGQL